MINWVTFPSDDCACLMTPKILDSSVHYFSGLYTCSAASSTFSGKLYIYIYIYGRICFLNG